MMQKSKFQAYSVERIADRSRLYAKRYLLNAKTFCILIFGFCILDFNIYAQPISSTELIENAKSYDGKTVVYQGEVVGEVMCRGNYCWANLKDGKNAIGIWLPKDLNKEIKYKGSYNTIGDWLEVSGIFNRACKEHIGDLDIHATTVRKIKEGRLIPEQVNLKKRNVAFMLLGVLCLILIWKRLKTS